MQEGDTCTVVCDKGERIVGQWICLTGAIRGSTPVCVDDELPYWTVAWVRPKIIGTFDFHGEAARGVNVSTATIGNYRLNISQAISDILVNVNPAHFSVFNVLHFWESPDFILKGWEDGSIWRDEFGDPTLWKIHSFRVEFEFIVWDAKNLLEINERLLNALFDKWSPEQLAFQANMYKECEIWLTKFFPVKVPITYKETFVAPDSGPFTAKLSAAHRSRSTLWLLMVTSLLLVVFSNDAFFGHLRRAAAA